MYPEVTVIILNTNELHHLSDCLPSVLSQDYPNYRVVVVDNASTDGSIEYVSSNFPVVEIVKNKENLGYAGGNNVGFKHARGKYVAVLNPDTIVDKNWLSELIKHLEEDERIGVATSRILIYKSGLVNACGNIAHYTGLDFCRGLNEPASRYIRPEKVGALSGCAFVIRKELLDRLGGFDPDFFLYLEDVDLSWRVRLAGYDILYVPTSIVHHKFKLSIAPWKHFYLERNRHLMLLKNLSPKLLLVMLPALLLTEIVTWGYTVLQGDEYIKSKIRAYRWILSNLKLIKQKRKQIIKKTTDIAFLSLLEWKIPFEQTIDNRLLLKMANTIFNSLYHIHYSLIKKLLAV